MPSKHKSNSKAKPTDRCHNCDGLGHWAVDCKKPKRAQPHRGGKPSTFKANVAKQGYTADQVSTMINGMKQNKANYAAALDPDAVNLFIQIAERSLAKDSTVTVTDSYGYDGDSDEYDLFQLATADPALW